MSKIFYEKNQKRYSIRDLQKDDCDELHIILDEPIDARIVINGRLTADVTDGRAVIKSSYLEEGKCSPLIYTKSTSARLEPFFFFHGIASIVESEEYLYRMQGEISALKREIHSLEEKIKCLEEKINGNPIF